MSSDDSLRLPGSVAVLGSCSVAELIVAATPSALTARVYAWAFENSANVPARSELVFVGRPIEISSKRTAWVPPM